MNNEPAPRSPRAVTAIAAVLALSAIPFASVASAQEAQPATAPSLSLPQDVNTGSPAQGAAATVTPTTPTLTLPPEATAPANVPSGTATTAGTAPQSSVVVPEVAPPPPVEAEAAAPAPARSAPRAQARTPRTAVADVAETPAASVPTARNQGAAADGVLAQGAVPPAAPAPVRADTPPPSAAAPAPAPAQPGSDLPIAGIAGLLAALGVAGLGIAAMRRRRREPEPVYEEAEYAPEPALMPAPAAEAAPVYAAPVRTTVVAGSAGAVLAASPLPQTADERRDLLDHMVAAEPDEDNPFTAHKARMRRARIQLQHREQAEEAAPKPSGNFDFRNYRAPTRTSGEAIPAKPGLIDA